MDITPFVNNAAILLSLGFLSTYLRTRWTKEFEIKELTLGILYGLFTILAMLTPMIFAPGIIFDGRSIIMSLVGLFEPPLVVLIAAILGSIFRIYLGGTGAFVGVGSIIISSVAGILFNRLVAVKKIRLNAWRLLAFGFSVHLLLILWFFNFPRDIALTIIRSIAFPYLFIFSIATMLIGLFTLSQIERLIMVKNLAKNESKYRKLINTMLEGIWAIDQDAVTTFVNPGMAKMLGYTEDEMTGRPVDAFLTKSCKKQLHQKLSRQAQGISEKYDFEYLHKDGRTIDVSVSSTPLYDDNGKFSGSLAAIQDITDRKSAERQLELQSRHLEEMVEARTNDLREAQANLMQAEKMTTLGELAGGVGHELRNPLSVIRNALYLLRAVENKDAQWLKYIALIEQEVQNASRIITGLLDYSHIQPTRPVVCNPADIVGMLMDEKTLPKNVKLVLDVPRSLQQVLVNPQQISQILDCFIKNACEAMPDGGTLTVSAKKSGSFVGIAVMDTGCGINPAGMKKLFEPLFTTKPHRVGLGLPLAKRLADLNNALIRVKSNTGEGSTFSLSLPISSLNE